MLLMRIFDLVKLIPQPLTACHQTLYERLQTLNSYSISMVVVHNDVCPILHVLDRIGLRSDLSRMS